MNFILNLNSMGVTFLFIIFLFVAIKSLVNYMHNKAERKKYHPVAGTIFNELVNFNRLHDYMTDLASKYKTYRLITPFRSEVFTSDPANVEYILKTNFENYGKGCYNHSLLKDLLRDGIFTVDGEKWREQRKVSIHHLSTKLQKVFSSTVFKENAVKLANIVSEGVISKQPMDIQELFMKSTLDSIFKVAFGVELDSLCGSNEGVKFCKAFDDANATITWRFVDVLWKIKKALSVGSEPMLKKNIALVDKFVYKLIHSKTELVHSIMNLKKEDIVSRSLQLTEADPKYLRDIVLNFLMAGKDTTSAALSWFIYMLCKHPIVQEKVAREIEEATNSKGIANSTSISEFVDSLSEETLEKMHYLHATLTETLRLYPSLPMDPKLCMSDDTMPDGFHLRKGDLVVYLPYAMGRMRFLWGDDAQEFRPERWLDDNGRFRSESPFKFTAFQAGPRVCLGKEFAYRQMKIFSAVLLKWFVFKLSDESKLVKYRRMMILQIDGGLSVRAYHRDQ